MNFGTGSAATSRTSAYRDEDEGNGGCGHFQSGYDFCHSVFIWSTQLLCAPLGDVILAIELCTAPNIIDLPDDDEEPERPLTRKNRQAPASKVSQSTPRAKPVVQDTGDANRGSVTFAEPLSSALPSSSTARALSTAFTFCNPSCPRGQGECC